MADIKNFLYKLPHLLMIYLFYLKYKNSKNIAFPIFGKADSTSVINSFQYAKKDISRIVIRI